MRDLSKCGRKEIWTAVNEKLRQRKWTSGSATTGTLLQTWNFSSQELECRRNRLCSGKQSKGGDVLGPSKAVYAGPIPRVSGGSGKDGLTVKYSATNAEGTLMPPFFVFPEQRPTAYDQSTGVIIGTSFD